MARSLHPERDLEIVALYCETNSMEDVARRFGLTRQGVRYVLKREGINTSSKKKPITAALPKTRLTSRERFWSRVDRTGGDDACWLWQSYYHKGSYGRMSFKGKIEYSHQLTWFFTYGRKPVYRLRSNCGNYLCCNPKHWRELLPIAK